MTIKAEYLLPIKPRAFAKLIGDDKMAEKVKKMLLDRMFNQLKNKE